MEELASSRYVASSKPPSLLCMLTSNQWYATAPSLRATVAPYSLTLGYPSYLSYNESDPAQFTFLVSTFRSQTTVSSWSDLVGISVNVTSNFFTGDEEENGNYTLTYSGRNGREGEPINDFELWNFTYVVPETWEGQESGQGPQMRLKLELL
jgi:hypothetical protein